MNQKIKTVLVHGSLGSGKTTLLTALLNSERFQKSFVIENEFANENIDKYAVSDHQHTEARVYDIAGGCICCSSGKELFEALQMLVDTSWGHSLIIETTGIAQSPQLIKQLYLNPLFIQHFTLVKNIYVVDPLEQTSESLRNEHFFDIALCDVVVVGKVDLLTYSNVVQQYKETVHSINPEAIVLPVHNGQHTVENYKFEDGSQTEQRLMRHIATIPVLESQQHGMQYSIERLTEAVSVELLKGLLDNIKQRPELSIKRVKGYVFDQDDQWWHIEMTANHIAVTPSPQRPEAVIVIIGGSITENFVSNYLHQAI